MLSILTIYYCFSAYAALLVRYYAPQDLFLGAVIPLATGHTLVVVEMDRSSLKLCEEHPQDYPLMDRQRILRRLALRVRDMRLDLRG